MAAPSFRDAYDCAVVGDGWAAALFAGELSRAGLSTVQVTQEAYRAVDAWLHPRLQQDELDQLPTRNHVRGIVVLDVAGDTVEVLKPNLLAPWRFGTVTLFEARRQFVPTTPVFDGNARCVVQFVSGTKPQFAVGGIYRDVTREAGDEQFAQLFQTRVPGMVAWLAACGSGLFSLGIIRTGGEGGNGNTAAADMLEEALVACPALTRRLAHAELVGELHTRANPLCAPKMSGTDKEVFLPAYDAEIDPLFAGGYELACRGGAELAAVLMARGGLPGSDRQRIAAWREGWRETEQGVRNLVRYYYSCPPARDRSPADSWHALRESSPDFA